MKIVIKREREATVQQDVTPAWPKLQLAEAFTHSSNLSHICSAVLHSYVYSKTKKQNTTKNINTHIKFTTKSAYDISHIPWQVFSQKKGREAAASTLCVMRGKGKMADRGKVRHATATWKWKKNNNDKNKGEWEVEQWHSTKWKSLVMNFEHSCVIPGCYNVMSIFSNKYDHYFICIICYYCCILLYESKLTAIRSFNNCIIFSCYTLWENKLANTWAAATQTLFTYAALSLL